jgi:hypothetical protein
MSVSNAKITAFSIIEMAEGGREELDTQALAQQPDAGRVFRVTGLGAHGPGCNLYRGSLAG